MTRRTGLLWLVATPTAALLLVAAWKLYTPEVAAPALAESPKLYNLAPVDIPVIGEQAARESAPEAEPVSPSPAIKEAMRGLRLRPTTPPQREGDALVVPEPVRVPNRDARRTLNELRRRILAQQQK